MQKRMKQKIQNKIIAYLRGLNRINYRTSDELKDVISSFVEEIYRKSKLRKKVIVDVKGI